LEVGQLKPAPRPEPLRPSATTTPTSPPRLRADQPKAPRDFGWRPTEQTGVGSVRHPPRQQTARFEWQQAAYYEHESDCVWSQKTPPEIIQRIEAMDDDSLLLLHRVLLLVEKATAMGELSAEARKTAEQESPNGSRIILRRGPNCARDDSLYRYQYRRTSLAEQHPFHDSRRRVADMTWAVSTPILLEYEEVLTRLSGPCRWRKLARSWTWPNSPANLLRVTPLFSVHVVRRTLMITSSLTAPSRPTPTIWSPRIATSRLC